MPAMPVSLDRTDKRILAELRQNGRQSIQNLGEKIGLSATPCARRVKLLEQEAIILGYSAILNEEKLGFGFSVFVSVKLDHQFDARLATFEQQINECPEVVDCWLMTGNRDYLMRVAVKDLNEFERFLTQRLTKIPGVASIESSIPIRQVKRDATRLE